MNGGIIMWVETRKIDNPDSKSKKSLVTRYKFVERYKSPLTGKYHKVSVTYDKLNNRVRKDAAFQLEQKIKEAINSEQQIDTNITIRELADKFLKLYKEQVAYTTFYSATLGLRRFCKDFGKDTIANRITTKMLNQYLDERLYSKSKPLTNAGIQLVKKHISLLFKYGIKYGYVKSNPVEHVSINWRSEKQRKLERIENKYLTDEEFLKILQYCDERGRNDMHDIFEWLYYTGMRFGEASALQLKDIHKENGIWIASVNGSMFLYRNQDAPSTGKRFAKSEGAKTIAGDRDVSLSKQAIEIYKRNKREKTPSDFLFINKISHNPMREAAANRFLHRIQNEKSIKKNITTHFFRHTHVTKLAELGVPLYVIQRRVGHSNSKITQQLYLHVTQKSKQEVIDKLNHFAPSVPPEDKL